VHAQSSKRAMGRDVVSLMRHLGREQFAVVGHDRGSLVAFRTAMDHPNAVTRLVMTDGLPVVEHLERLTEAFVRNWWHWWFLGQTEKPAERVINPDAWYRTPSPAEMGEGNHADVWTAVQDPAVVHGMCEDYRGGPCIDRTHEEADRLAGRQIGHARTTDEIRFALPKQVGDARLRRSRNSPRGRPGTFVAADELTSALLSALCRGLSRPTSRYVSRKKSRAPAGCDHGFRADGSLATDVGEPRRCCATGARPPSGGQESDVRQTRQERERRTAGG
jgi:pimeloyl-ACP methyl ester carboxylesterase